MVRKKNKVRKEEIAEDWCFECLDGGKLRVCDHRDCLKVYHPDCVGKDDSFLEDNSYWTCRSHSCKYCSKTSEFRCLCCPNAVCGNCVNFNVFAVVKGKKGFCRQCSKYAGLIEGNIDVDCDGENVDFKDRETYECLFSEYYKIIKKEEGLNAQNVYSAGDLFKNGNNEWYLDPNETTEKTESFLAAIVSSNLKLVYLRQTLMEELLKQPETFDSKVLGSFVRIKSDPKDNLQKNSHLLVQVKGINRSSTNDENNNEILLQLSHVPKGVPICKISDYNFTEEECHDLYQRMRIGLLKQPTKLELEQKARSLHEDIIKHEISRELKFLQNRIEWANIYRRKKELSEYIDRRSELENPLKQSGLLSNIPKVIPEIADTNSSREGSPSKDKLEQNGLPELAIRETSESDGCYFKLNGFARCLNKRTDVPDLPVQEQQYAEPEKQKLDRDVEQAKDRENELTTLVADGIGKQNGAPDSGATDNSEARIDFTPEANILEKGIGSSTVPGPTIMDNRKRKNPSS